MTGVAKRQKRLTVKEKEERKRTREILKREGILPPDKPRLNRKKFAKETAKEFDSEIHIADLTDMLCLHEALMFMTAGTDMFPVTPEQIGVFKVMKIAVELKRLRQRKNEAGQSLVLKDLYDTAQPIMKQ